VPKSQLDTQTQTHTYTHTWSDSFERAISLSQRPLLTQHTTNTRDDHPCPQGDPNPQFQQTNGRTPTP